MRVQFASAPGVQENTPVHFCGYRVGSVVRVEPPRILKEVDSERYYHQTVVVISINRKYDNIPAEVEVKLMKRGLGSSYIELKAPIPEPNELVTKFLSGKSKLQGSTGITSEFFPEESQKKLDVLIETVRVFIKNSNDIIGDPNNKENLKKILANLSDTTGEATKAIKEFKELSVAGTNFLKKADTKMEGLVNAFVNASGELSETVKELHMILAKVNEGQGTAARLVNDGRLYENLLESTQQLQLLLQDVRDFIAEYRKKGIKVKL